MITNEELGAELKEMREQLRTLQVYVQGRSDSIELSHTSTGKYSWSVKVYNNDDGAAMDKVRRMEEGIAKVYGV